MVPVSKPGHRLGPSRMPSDEHMGLTQGFIRDQAYEQNKFPTSTTDRLGLLIVSGLPSSPP